MKFQCTKANYLLKTSPGSLIHMNSFSLVAAVQ